MDLSSRRPLLALLLCALAIACSSAPEDAAGSPAAAVKQFYGHLNDGDYSDAVALYGTEAMEIVKNADGVVDPGFAEWAGQETRKGQVDRINVLDQQQEAERATVEYEVVYKDGTTKQSKVTLTLEEGLWKLGIIG